MQDNKTNNTLDKLLEKVSIKTELSVGSLVDDYALEAIKQYYANREKQMLEFVIGEDLTTGKRGTPEYTRKYVVDIQNHEKAQARQRAKEWEKRKSKIMLSILQIEELPIFNSKVLNVLLRNIKLDIVVPVWYNSMVNITKGLSMSNQLTKIKTTSWSLQYELDQDFNERGVEDYGIEGFSEAFISLAKKLKDWRGEIEITPDEAKELVKSLENIIDIQQDYLDDAEGRGMMRSAQAMLKKARMIVG